ncbi:unnamed protein product [Amoebophrya sp. A25]|nr:unnamed protein product [Amoebophrya sp. A25]|eukprot:GSA25T00008293001.1
MHFHLNLCKLESEKSAKKMKKFQVLCLHGHAQSGESFRQRIGSLRSPLKKWCDFHFLDGPFEVPHCEHSTSISRGGGGGGGGGDISSDPGGLGGQPDAAESKVPLATAMQNTRSWVPPAADKPNRAHADPEMFKRGVLQSLSMVQKTIVEKQVDGLLGFSMGAALIVALMGRINGSARPRQLKFVLFFSGFVPDKDPGMADAIRKHLSSAGVASLSSFHCFGLKDEIITPERSRELFSLFKSRSTNCELLAEQDDRNQEVLHLSTDPATIDEPRVSRSPDLETVTEVFEHPGGHLVPSQAKKALVSFIQAMVEREAQRQRT